MNNKYADNRININVNSKINNKFDNQITEEEKRLKKIDNMQEEFISFNKTMNNCLELLSSCKGGNSNRRYDEIQQESTSILRNVTELLEDEKPNIRKNIEDLQSKRNKMQKEQRDNHN